MTSICCVCNKTKQQGRWIAGEVPSDQDHLSHGYCPTCYGDVLADIALFLDVQESGQALPVYALPAADVAVACA